MRAARVDANHAAIVDTFRRLGWSVQSLAAIGHGCPDLLAAKQGVTIVVEVKAGRGKLREQQEAWIGAWHATVFLVRTVEDVLAIDANGSWRESALVNLAWSVHTRGDPPS